MRKFILFGIAILTTVVATRGQDKGLSFVPVNTPYLLAGSLRPSIHLSKGVDQLVIGGAFGVGFDEYGVSGENGVFGEYRIGLNRDKNVSFPINSFLGINYTLTKNTQDTMYRSEYNYNYIGVSFGSTFRIEKKVFIEIWLGLGRSSFDFKDPQDYDYTVGDGTGGLNVGFNF